MRLLILCICDPVSGEECQCRGEGEGGEEQGEEGIQPRQQVRGQPTFSQSLKHPTVLCNLGITSLLHHSILFIEVLTISWLTCGTGSSGME